MIALVIALAGTYLAALPVIDGDIREAISTAPLFSIAKGDSAVRVWIGRRDDWVYVVADLPDTSYYWGDDFVVSVDPDGSGGATPGVGDRQWYLRRDVDSSVVATAANGRWNFAPPLGRVHRGEDWEAGARSTARGWTVELFFHVPAAAKPRIAFRTYDSAPQGWWSWPAPPESTRATRVERQPDLWMRLP